MPIAIFAKRCIHSTVFLDSEQSHLSTILPAFTAFLLVSADENEFRLIRDVMSRYDKRIRPCTNHTLPTTINFSVALAQIIDVVI